MIRVLVIGCGKIGTAGHLPALAALRDERLVEVVACDANPATAEAAGTTFGVRWVTDWEQAASEADAAAVCLIPGVNAEIAAAAVGRGLHVLCEKPPGRTVAEAEALAAAAAARPDRVTMVAFNRRFNPLYRSAMERSLALAPPTSFYGRFSQAALGSPPDDHVADWLTSSGSHALDLAVATVGFPSAVSVARRSLGGGPDNAWTIHLHGERGGALVLLHFAAGRRVERYEWAGPGYDVVVDLPKRAEWAQSGRKSEAWANDGSGYHEINGFVAQYRAFLAAIAGDGPRPEADFGYAPAFLGLIETILTAPDGTLQAVPPRRAEPVAERATPVGAAAAAARPARARPVVVLHHPPRLHDRFFSVAALTALRARCEVRTPAAPDDTGVYKGAQILVTGRGVKGGLAPAIVDLAPDLELVVVLGASFQNYAADALLDRGVAIANTADAVAQSVAEHCLMATLAGLRRLPQTDQAMRAGEWPRPGAPATRRRLDVKAMVRDGPLPPAVVDFLRKANRRLAGNRRDAAGAPGPAGPGGPSDLQGQTVGLIGWGHTARRFAALLGPFGVTILVASEGGDPAEIDAAGARRVSLGELLAGSKVVSLHKGLTERTRGLLGATQLAQLRPGTVLVNAARGELIDETALLERLARGDIVAALDVFAEEPLPKAHPLRKVPNVILTPHHASTTDQEERRMGDEAVAKVLAWVDGRAVAVVDRRRLDRMT